MATSLTGPAEAAFSSPSCRYVSSTTNPPADMALATAPHPRPPQPIRARRMVLFSPAWTCGMATPARAEAAATRAVVLRNSRRGVLLVVSLMVSLPSQRVFLGCRRSSDHQFRRGPRRRQPPADFAGRYGDRLGAKAVILTANCSIASLGCKQPLGGVSWSCAGTMDATYTAAPRLARRDWTEGPSSAMRAVASCPGHTSVSISRRKGSLDG